MAAISPLIISAPLQQSTSHWTNYVTYVCIVCKAVLAALCQHRLRSERSWYSNHEHKLKCCQEAKVSYKQWKTQLRCPDTKGMCSANNVTNQNYRFSCLYFLLPFRNSPPPSGSRPPHYRVFMVTLRHTTLDRSPLDEWSARRRDLYLTTHNTHNRQTSIPPAGFEPAIPSKCTATDKSLSDCYFILDCQCLLCAKGCICNRQTKYLRSLKFQKLQTVNYLTVSIVKRISALSVFQDCSMFAKVGHKSHICLTIHSFPLYEPHCTFSSPSFHYRGPHNWKSPTRRCVQQHDWTPLKWRSAETPIKVGHMIFFYYSRLLAL